MDNPVTPITAEAAKDASGQDYVSSQAKPKAHAKITRYDMIYNQKLCRYEAKKSYQPVVTVEPKRAKKKRTAMIVVRRFMDQDGQHTKTVAEILHEPLSELLQDIWGDFADVFPDNDSRSGFRGSTRTLDAKLLFYSYGELKDWLRRSEDTEDPKLKEEGKIEGAQVAIELIEEDFKPEIAAYNNLVNKKQTTFEYLWTLFRPRTQVCAYDNELEQNYMAVVTRFQYIIPEKYSRSEVPPHADIMCEILAHDNRSLGRVVIDLKIPMFKGALSIIDLPVFPLKYHENCHTLREMAIARGRIYADMRLHFCEYHGVARVNGLKLVMNERIMVDPESSFEYGPGDDYVDRRILSLEDLSDDDYLICTPRLLGFCFKTKAWGRFSIDRISPIQWSHEPFERLVLGAKQKRLISALVKQHATGSDNFDDLVAGKGLGLVGLLCGKPGCGKTLTAEAVAEVTHRPLYAVSAGELGTDSEDTDRTLKRILRLGERWNAVVLLDEADVFMQERDRTDVVRNALVSIFLRQVEYYPGILIFTTNLINDIDPAFESRIHFCVRYPDLDFASRKSIWRIFLSKAESAGAIFGEPDLVSLAQKPLNGRQIKNAVSTAKSIASSESSPLTLQHIQTVLEVMQDWQVARSEETGSEETGSEETGSEQTGSEETGSEQTRSEETGSEQTRSEQTAHPYHRLLPAIVGLVAIVAAMYLRSLSPHVPYDLSLMHL